MEYAYRVWHTKKQVPTFYAGLSIAGAQNFKKKSKFRHSFLDPQPFWEIGNIMERLHHALPIKIKNVKFKWVGWRECGKNCFGAMIYVCDRPGPPLSQISKILFCSPPSYMIPQPPPKNKVIWWCSGLGVNTTTMAPKPDGKCIGMMTPERFHLLKKGSMKLKKWICPLLSSA